MKHYIILMIVTLICVGGIGYYFWQKNYLKKAPVNVEAVNYTNSTMNYDSEKSTIINNGKYNFEFIYPTSWKQAQDESNDNLYTFYPDYGLSVVELFIAENPDWAVFATEPFWRKEFFVGDYLINNFFSFKGLESKKFKGKAAKTNSEVQVIQFKSGNLAFVFVAVYPWDITNSGFLSDFNSVVQSLNFIDKR